MTDLNAAIEGLLQHRVLPVRPFETFADYVAAGGGGGLRRAEEMSSTELIELVTAAGLRGRGGGGFPTGVKWRTVAGFASESLPTTVVVNGAEGEPGTFKDRAIVRANPYAVVEGAVIAARAVGAPTVVIALKESFAKELERTKTAIAEIVAAGVVDDGVVSVFAGPREYLYGEETALLESIAGRPPFPRIAPPWRRGVTELVATADDATSESGLAAPVDMAGNTDAPPTLVNNVETLANVPGIVVHGADWFRSVGTDESPGTVVCTVSGSTKRAGVGEVAMGTPIRSVIDAIGGGVQDGRSISAVLFGVANAVLTHNQLDTPLSYEGMMAAGSGLGSAGAIVLADDIDLTAAAAGVAQFLAIESCGQCTPCKQDGLAISGGLRDLCASPSDAQLIPVVQDHLATVADGARCALASQQQAVVGSLLALLGPAGVTDPEATSIAPLLIAELIDIDVDGVATYDDGYAGKQPDWTYDEVDSGQSPVDRLTDRRADPEQQ